MAAIPRLKHLFAHDIAVDLGTDNTLIYTKNSGLVLNAPSVVSVDVKTGEVLAIGEDAKRAYGKTPARIKTVHPLRSGVIADFDMACRMLIHFLHKVFGRQLVGKPSMVISVPTGITEVEKRAVINAAQSTGAIDVALVEEPLAAAIGAELPVHEPRGIFVADIGGGTSEVAVITMSAISVSQSVRTGGDAMDEAILTALRKQYRLDVGANTAERIKNTIGSAVEVPELEPLLVSGKDLAHGCPMTVAVKPEFVREALRESVEEIANAVMHTLEQTPPELAADIHDSGLLLTGGASLLHGLDILLAQRTQLEVRHDSNPLTTVIRGVAKAMQDRTFYADVFL